jgi:hypothetical protein
VTDGPPFLLWEPQGRRVCFVTRGGGERGLFFRATCDKKAAQVFALGSGTVWWVGGTKYIWKAQISTHSGTVCALSCVSFFRGVPVVECVLLRWRHWNAPKHCTSAARARHTGAAVIRAFANGAKGTHSATNTHAHIRAGAEKVKKMRCAGFFFCFSHSQLFWI